MQFLVRYCIVIDSTPETDSDSSRFILLHMSDDSKTKYKKTNKTAAEGTVTVLLIRRHVYLTKQQEKRGLPQALDISR